MGNASSVNEATSAQAIGLAKAASIASRLKKGSNGGHAEMFVFENLLFSTM